ncbi:MAG TPA: hypothetical protein VMU54_22515, partial [Planctomycetota bacterium]|nr:hypothetical protein [Planctomycetota bacterium]
FFLLRMVAAEAELMKIIERYQAEPAHPDWSMKFRQHQGCRYGRVRWLHGDTLMPATDSGSIALTHRRLREFGVPKREFAALLVHERARRRMTSVHAPYVEAMGRIQTHARKALSRVDERLRHQDLCGTAALQV